MGSPYRSAYCVIEYLLRPMGWGSSGVAVEGLQSLWSQSSDWSVEWLELSWHLTALERGRGLGKGEADAQLRRRKEMP